MSKIDLIFFYNLAFLRKKQNIFEVKMNLLLADIGGTNARFGFKKNDDDKEITNITYLKCSDFTNIHQAINHYKQTNNLVIDSMSLAVASTTKNNSIKFTNNNWDFKQTELFKFFNLKKILFINDFVAQALCFSSFYTNLTEDKNINKDLSIKNNLKVIRQGTPILKAPLLVTGPGTGLGVCTLFLSEQNPIAIEGEGGHVTFAPNSDLEIKLLLFLRKKYDHISMERIVSGSGIEEIYNFILNQKGLKPSILKAPEIGKKALLGEENALKSVKIMFGILGTIISNIILINGAQSGVIISGGITPKLQSIMEKSDFEKNLLNKGRRSDYIKNVPIWLTEDNNNGLIGALNAYKNPHYEYKIISK